jgi:hypothetical protein
LGVRVHILKDKLSFAFVRTTCYVSFDVFLSFQDFIRTIMAEVVITALAHEHGIEVSEADWAIVLE